MSTMKQMKINIICGQKIEDKKETKQITKRERERER